MMSLADQLAHFDKLDMACHPATVAVYEFNDVISKTLGVPESPYFVARLPDHLCSSENSTPLSADEALWSTLSKLEAA